MASPNWALSRISQLLPLDRDSLQQILDYSSTLSKNEAAEHFTDLLGDSPEALQFISSFASLQNIPPTTTAVPAPAPVPAPAETAPAATASRPSDYSRKPRKKKAPLNNLPPPRRPEDYGNTSGAYSKRDGEDYISAARRPGKDRATAISSALSDQPDARQLPIAVSDIATKLPPSAAGPLISDLPNMRTSSRTSSPASKTKINVSGGIPMHGASSTLQDLDSAIRALELQTNPSLSASPSSRRCDCMATRHPLLAAAPNCLSCGKIICVKEGIGPCTFCSQPLLSPAEINSMIRSLREERGQEKMSINNATHRRAELSQNLRPFSTPPRSSSPDVRNQDSMSNSLTEQKLDLARQHRDKLLAFQSENAQRTHIIDEAADFETPSSGQNMWGNPVERAAQLKRQQKLLREQEWNAQPEYEKRRVVVSVDIVGGKAVKRMAEVERPRGNDGIEDAAETSHHEPTFNPQASTDAGGAFRNNPLMAGLIRPVWKDTTTPAAGNDNDPPDRAKDGDGQHARKNTWRRVQDDEDDNEAWILDGGVYGARGVLGAEQEAMG